MPGDLPPVLLDTSVVIGALIKPAGLPYRVLAGVAEADVLVATPRILAEYRTSIPKDRATRNHGLPLDVIDAFVDSLEVLAFIPNIERAGPTCPDKRDQHFLDALASVPGSVLVTGETKLLQSKHFPGRVVTPRKFVERFLSD